MLPAKNEKKAEAVDVGNCRERVPALTFIDDRVNFMRPDSGEARGLANFLLTGALCRMETSMTDDSEKRPSGTVLEDFRQLSLGAWIAIVVLIGLLLMAIVGVSLSGTDDLASGVSGPGTIAMILGVLFTIVIGAGLMGLIFYSSRRGYDDAATVESTDIGHKH
jgi:hypothetical protein